LGVFKQVQDRLYKYLVNPGGYLYPITQKIQDLVKAGDNRNLSLCRSLHLEQILMILHYFRLLAQNQKSNLRKNYYSSGVKKELLF
jgi:hypothetical protein